MRATTEARFDEENAAPLTIANDGYSKNSNRSTQPDRSSCAVTFAGCTLMLTL